MLLSTMLAALAAPMPARACSGSEPRTEAAVRAAEDRWVHLLEARDVGGLACLLAPEFTDTNWLGRKVARASVLAALPHRPDSRLTLSEVVVRTYGTVAIVQGLNRQTDRAGRAAGAVRFTDIFLYRERRWQAVFAQETPAPAAR